MSLLYAVHNSYYTPAHIVRLGGSACPPTKAVIEGTASLHSTQGVGIGVGVV